MYQRKALKHMQRAQELMGFGRSFNKGFMKNFNKVNNVLHKVALNNQKDFILEDEHIDMIDEKSWNNTPIMLALKCGALEIVSAFLTHMDNIVNRHRSKVFNVLAAKDSYGITFTSLVCALRLSDVFKRIRNIQLKLSEKDQFELNEIQIKQVPPKTPNIDEGEEMRYPPDIHNEVDWHEYFANKLYPSSEGKSLLMQQDLYKSEVYASNQAHLFWNNLCPYEQDQDCYTYFPRAWALSSILIFHLRDFVANAISPDISPELDFSYIDAALQDTEKRRRSFTLLDHFIKWRNSNEWVTIKSTKTTGASEKNLDSKWTCA